VDYAEEIASDLSAFHRVDDPLEISAERYFGLAYFLGSYMGAVASRAIEESKAERGGGHGHDEVRHVHESDAFGMLAGTEWDIERGGDT
jgi:hypothetical protein